MATSYTYASTYHKLQQTSLQFHRTDTVEPTTYLYPGVQHFTYIQASFKITLNISSYLTNAHTSAGPATARASDSISRPCARYKLILLYCSVLRTGRLYWFLGGTI